MTLPEHIEHVDEEREARAPYNFVPLPNTVVTAEEPPHQDRYHSDLLTGHIECRLTTETPLYVRSGWDPADFAEHGETSFDKLPPEEQAKRARFFHHGDLGKPYIPGSSLRGMLRTLVEIAGYGKMERVTDRPRYFFRAVAAKSEDPLDEPYRDLLRHVQAGYLVKRGSEWYIQPAREINRTSFIKIHERFIDKQHIGLIGLRDPHYRPQYIQVSFTHKTAVDKRGQRIERIDALDLPGVLPNAGWLVTSGNMSETGSSSVSTNRTTHYVVPEPQGELLKIADQAIQDYRTGLTDFQKGPTDIKPESDRPFSKSDGVLQDGRPVFFCRPSRGSDIHFFGHSPNFRIPYWRENLKRTATPADFVPSYLKDPVVIDIAEAIFGFVRPEKQAEDQTQACAGRVFIGNAALEHGQCGEPITPHILGGPKPTTFQHYLVQTEADLVQAGINRQGKPIYKLPLAHYGSQTPQATVIRGHKLYWHKPGTTQHQVCEADEQKIQDSASQYTRICPVAPGAVFSFTIRFENLSRIELGALLWVLRLAADDCYRLKLGMGKPLGMGSIRIEHSVSLSNRASRYRQLFSKSAWHKAQATMPADDIAACIKEFEDYVLKESKEPAKSLDKTLRIGCLLALLSWQGAPPVEQTRYMKIERKVADGHIPAVKPKRGSDKVNEYSTRAVLPLPTQVTGQTTAPAPGHTSGAPQRRTSNPGSANQPHAQSAQPAEASQISFEIGIPVTGQRKGEYREGSIRGIKIELNKNKFPAPKGVTLTVILRREDAGSNKSPTGGFSGVIVGKEERRGGRELILFVAPAK
jgi:CRISPR-associated protein (TIGR03986 family)